METNGIYKGGGPNKKQEVVTIITEINIETDAKNELINNFINTFSTTKRIENLTKFFF